MCDPRVEGRLDDRRVTLTRQLLADEFAQRPDVLARFDPDAERRLLFLAHWDTRPTSDAEDTPEERARGWIEGYYADPAFSEQPIEGLLSKEYGASRAELIDPARAARRVEAGHPGLGRFLGRERGAHPP